VDTSSLARSSHLLVAWLGNLVPAEAVASHSNSLTVPLSKRGGTLTAGVVEWGNGGGCAGVGWELIGTFGKGGE